MGGENVLRLLISLKALSIRAWIRRKDRLALTGGRTVLLQCPEQSLGPEGQRGEARPGPQVLQQQPEGGVLGGVAEVLPVVLQPGLDQSLQGAGETQRRTRLRFSVFKSLPNPSRHSRGGFMGNTLDPDLACNK